MLQDLYRNLVISHDKYRKNNGMLDGENVQKVHYKNPTCGDVITLYLRIENEIVQDVSFEGEGCSISMASSSMMTELIKNRDVETISTYRDSFEQLIRHGEKPVDNIDLGDALALEGVHKLRARHNCALMAWQALDKILDDGEAYRKRKEVVKSI
ncbi:Fe-S cluster assembly sulfur transfer protein SufU [Alteribacillus sp. HJP-4]|uniref:Fe-S cluster assembly sulfur transfer protein SufU n=1 Tax=Alteribacillus sp. HJP-4 TaxID=2775394 RepID=UPI0035CCFDA9